jgi:hypothetical protein
LVNTLKKREKRERVKGIINFGEREWRKGLRGSIANDKILQFSVSSVTMPSEWRVVTVVVSDSLQAAYALWRCRRKRPSQPTDLRCRSTLHLPERNINQREKRDDSLGSKNYVGFGSAHISANITKLQGKKQICKIALPQREPQFAKHIVI